MRISLIIDKPYQRNKIFDEKNLIINRDDCQRPLIELKSKLEQNRISLNTVDLTPIPSCDLAFFINVPDRDNEYFKEAQSLNKPCYVLINELAMILPQNAFHEMHKHFMKIFTYQQELLEDQRIFKVNYSFNFEEKLKRFKPAPFDNKKLCTLIAGYKKLDHPLELYSERIKTIRWFERNHSSEFDLYGQGWNKYGFLRSLITRKFPSYKGPVVEKQKILAKYKFNICYENAKNVSGWITEKIFDSFFAGTVPVYWGWKGVSNYIPVNCFIDREDFKNHGELYSYMSSMTSVEYEGYINNIFNFLQTKVSDINYEFSISYFINTIEREILKDFNQ